MFGNLIHVAYENMIICAKFNILYTYMEQFYDIYNTYTENGYHIFKYDYYYNFINIVDKLEKIDRHLYFDFNKIV